MDKKNLLLEYPPDVEEFDELYWTDFTENLSDIIKERNPDGYWIVNGENMGWRNRSGEKAILAENGKELMEGILPNDVEVTIEIYKGILSTLLVKLYHHDSPMGETYNLKPITEEKYNTYVQDVANNGVRIQ